MSGSPQPPPPSAPPPPGESALRFEPARKTKWTTSLGVILSLALVGAAVGAVLPFLVIEVGNNDDPYAGLIILLTAPAGFLVGLVVGALIVAVKGNR